MSDHEPTRPSSQPPGGSSAKPEYLEHGHGAVLSPAPPGTGTRVRRPRRTALLVIGGLVLAGGLGAGAFAARSFFKQGAQPAEALPASTMAYAAVDLDPSGGQKIDALRTLNKFPAIKDEISVTDAGQIRERIGEAIIKDIGCDGLTFGKDLDPWMGDRAAVAVVDLGETDPAPVVVVQVKDDRAAEAGITRLASCSGSASTDFGFDVRDGWAVMAQSKAQADQVVAATRKGSLADDATYQKWVKAVGDAGVVNMYAAPSVGDYLATELDSADSMFGSLGQAIPGIGSSEAHGSSLRINGTAFRGAPAADVSTAGSGLSDSLRSFTGGAATLRFNDGGIELAVVGDPGLSQGLLTSDQGGTVVSGLPDDTAAALGLGLQPGWFSSIVSREASSLGGRSADQVMRKLSRKTGLDLPADAETLAGSSLALSISKDFDLEATENAESADGVPVAVTVRGDAPAIQAVLAKLTTHEPATSSYLGSDTSGDLTAIGGDQAYRKQILAGGHLGDSDTFTSVIPDARHASTVLFVDFSLVDKLVASVAGGDREVTENLAPLRAVGVSAWAEGDGAHALFRVSTD